MTVLESPGKVLEFFVVKIMGTLLLQSAKKWRFILSGSIVGHIKEVNLRRAVLVRRWVTVSSYMVLDLTKPLRPTQPSVPVRWVNQVLACLSRVKVGSFCVCLVFSMSGGSVIPYGY